MNSWWTFLWHHDEPAEFLPCTVFWHMEAKYLKFLILFCFFLPLNSTFSFISSFPNTENVWKLSFCLYNCSSVTSLHADWFEATFFWMAIKRINTMLHMCFLCLECDTATTTSIIRWQHNLLVTDFVLFVTRRVPVKQDFKSLNTSHSSLEICLQRFLLGSFSFSSI